MILPLNPRVQLSVPSVADRVLLHTADEMSTHPAAQAREAAMQISLRTPGWWLHTDLDVLAEVEFSARGAPGEIHLAGGLSWPQLTEVVSSVLR